MQDEDIAGAIAAIFRPLERLHAAGLPEARGTKVRREAIHFLWELKDGTKFDSRRPHSIAARAYRLGGETALLRYEHSIPLASCMARLRDAARDTTTMLAALRLYVHPVIVLDEECTRLRTAGLNARLPEGADNADPFARYRATAIMIEGVPFDASD